MSSPVSYTHLDVYKRQVFDCLYHNCPLKDDIAGTVNSIAAITPEMLYTCTDAFYTPGNMVLAVAGNITRAQVLAALDPVSYTHLDVYKRQVCGGVGG